MSAKNYGVAHRIRQALFLREHGWQSRRRVFGKVFYKHIASGDIAGSLDEAERMERSRPNPRRNVLDPKAQDLLRIV